MKRGKPSPMLEDVAICAAMGWTFEMLSDQPAGFVERLCLYLETVQDMQAREHRRLEDEISRMKRMMR